MQPMKTIVHTNPKRVRTLHVEAPGCIVNITIGLTDMEGRAVTAVQVLADQYVGEEWDLPDFPSPDNGHAVSVRVRQRQSGDLEAQAAKATELRETMPDHILGDLTPYLTDTEVLEVYALNNQLALYNHLAALRTGHGAPAEETNG